MSGEGFAKRWSRLKRTTPEVVVPEEEPPALEGLPLGEIAGWLKRNVPQAWKTAAMRRLWVADPGIRDFVGLADYAWDWNGPGGAVPMTALDNMAELLMRAMGTEPKPEVAELAPAEVVPVAAVEVAVVTPARPARPVADSRRRGGRAEPV